MGYNQTYITGTAGRATVCWLYIHGISSDVHHLHGGASQLGLALHTWDIIRRASLARRGEPPCVGSTYMGYHQTYITCTAGRATVCWLYIHVRSSDVHHWHGGASHRVLALHTWDIIRRTSLARRGQPPAIGSTYMGYHQTYITGTAGRATVCWLYTRGISSYVGPHHWHGGASHRVLALHTWNIIRRTSLPRRGKPPCVGSTYVGDHQPCSREPDVSVHAISPTGRHGTDIVADTQVALRHRPQDAKLVEYLEIVFGQQLF